MGEKRINCLKNIFIHKTALVDKSASIGEGTKIWAFVQIGRGAKIGKNCVIGNGAYIDRDAIIGNNVKIHNKALIYRGIIIEDNCFIGPGTCFTNDKFPKNNTTRNLKGISWRLKKGACIGANCTILSDVNIGENTLVGAGSVVTKSLPANIIACGNPAKKIKNLK